MSENGPFIRRTEGDKGILFHQRRRLDDGDLVLLVNTSIEHPTAGILGGAFRGIEQWCPVTGKTLAYPFLETDQGVVGDFNLPPCGSLLLFFAKEPRQSASVVAKGKTTTLEPAGPMQIRRVEPNVLTLDYMDVTAGGETRKSTYFYQANQFAFQKNGMERNPWDSAVQYKDELIRKTFPPESGVEATYRFMIERPGAQAALDRDRAAGPLPDRLQRPTAGVPKPSRVFPSRSLGTRIPGGSTGRSARSTLRPPPRAARTR